jgi:CMP-N-acetylneuraminic acid synthetase
MLGGRPLLDYVIMAGQASRTLTRRICSTEHPQIAMECHRMKVEVHRRPESLCRDDTPVLDVLAHLLDDMEANGHGLPDMIALLQPTSPFVLPEDIDTAVSLLRSDLQADSVQTLCAFPHNYHAYNQRVVENGLVRFRFPAERKECHNKQRKPTFYIFGNLVVTRVRTIREQKDVFGARSLSLIIPDAYAIDVDGPEDLKKAEWLLTSGRVSLPHIHG